jgi:hypothetical protein
MKTYDIFIRWEGQSSQFLITGKLKVFNGFYLIEDQEGKEHYYPINRTMINEINPPEPKTTFIQ